MNNTSFWLRTSDELSDLKQAIEQALQGFSYYPEIEWNEYGFRPPEGLPFHGAWRSPSRTEFVYLVGERPRRTQTQVDRIILISGALGEDRLALLGARFESLSSQFRRREATTIAQQKMRARRKDFAENYSGGRMTAIFAVVTAAINATSLALRSLPQPKTNLVSLSVIYDTIQMLIHIVALSCILLLGVFCLLYFGRHLVYMVRS